MQVSQSEPILGSEKSFYVEDIETKANAIVI